jgi:FkbM family methyltransferase
MIGLTALFRKTAKLILDTCGYELHRADNLQAILAPYHISTVLDIGASRGQFAKYVRRLLPDAFIHSFEPIPAVYQELLAAMRGDTKFAAHAVALGDRTQSALMNVNDFSPSSSLLDMAETHVTAFPHSQHSHAQSVRVVPLDTWAEETALSDPMFLKLDVQGYEDRVLAGALQTLKRVSVVMTEVSFTELYRGQPLFDDIHTILRTNGFRCIGVINNVHMPQTGRLLQADALFERSGSPSTF